MIEKMVQRFVDFHLDLLNFCDKGSMKVNDLITHIDTFLGFLTNGNKALIIIDNIFAFIFFKVPLDVHFSNVRIIGLHIRH